MDVEALATEAQVLSAHYSTNTAVNLNPWRRSNTLGGTTATEGENRAMPTLSPAVLAFLAARHVASQDVATLANKAVINVPEVRDDLPFKRYFISSSHNTYLLGWQLFGHSSAAAYAHVLLAPAPARCIEIDVWWDRRPGRGGPVVTHGWTLSKSVPFVDVCAAIGEAVKRINDKGDGRDWPVLVSLECHVPHAHQDELAQIMLDCWGEMLVQGEIEDVSGETVTPRQLRGRIVLMVEYYPNEMTNGSDGDILLEAEEELDGEGCAIRETVGDAEECDPADAALAHLQIADSLANLGFYARSMKPPKVWWSQAFPSPPNPLNVILNISEAHHPSLPENFPILQQHATQYLRRVYPGGRRVTSSNLDPWVQWRGGTQMACLNWQNWDMGMWLNEAMFGGTGGWVARPDSELEDQGRTWKLTGRVVGLSALPWPAGDQHDFVGYCQAELFHRDGKRMWQSDPVVAQRDTVPESEAGAGNTDVIHITWDQTFEWTFDTDALAFLLIKVVRRHAVRRDEDVAVFCARLEYLASGWCLVRLLDTRGKHVGGTLLCEFTLE